VTTGTQSEYAGAFNDGETARSRAVTVRFDATALSIHDAQGAAFETWPLEDLHVVGEAFDGAPVRLKRGATGQARLTVKDPAFHAAVLHAAPQLRRNPNLGFKRIAGMIGSVAVLAAVLIIATPYVTDAAVDWIPNAWKRDAGERMVTEVLEILSENGALCEQGDGVAALNQMTARLSSAANEIDSSTKDGAPLALNVQVANIAHNNAFAMLGGQIVLFNGLLFNAKSAEEVAGVVAHEIGHVMHQHPSRALLRGIGLGLVFDLFLGGGRTAGFGQSMLAMSYSRDAEREADAIALAILDKAGVSPAGLADFLDRLNDGGATSNWLSTHPNSKDRAALIRAHQGARHTSPALTQAGWRALNGICQTAPKG
jgi:beta-barrel assembly-enhancing protease